MDETQIDFDLDVQMSGLEPPPEEQRKVQVGQPQGLDKFHTSTSRMLHSIIHAGWMACGLVRGQDGEIVSFVRWSQRCRASELV